MQWNGKYLQDFAVGELPCSVLKHQDFGSPSAPPEFGRASEIVLVADRSLVELFVILG